MAILIEGILLNRRSLRTDLLLTYWRQLQVLEVAIGLAFWLGGEVELVGMGVRVAKVVHVGELDVFKLHKVEVDHGLRWTIINRNFSHLIIVPERLTGFDA